MSFWHNQKDQRLQDLFRQLAEAVDQGSLFFQELMLTNGADGKVSISRKIVELEHRGDDLVNQIRQALADIAITSWIKQSDALQLSRLLDAILDGMRSTASLLEIYEIETIRPQVGEFAGLIRVMAQQVRELIEGLADHKYHRNSDAINAGVAKISKWESQADDLRAQALRQVWQEDRKGDLSMDLAFQWDKVIEALEMIADRAHHVANNVQTIITL